MKILHIIPNLNKGGAERICLDICIEMQSRSGHEILLVLLEDKTEYKNLSKQVKSIISKSTIQLSFKGKNQIDIDNLQNIIDDFKPNIIHSHLFLAELYSQHLNTAAPRFCHVHDNMSQLEKISKTKLFSKQGLLKQFERSYYLKLTKSKKINFICISRDAEKFILGNLPNKKHNTIYLPNAINTSVFKNQTVRTLGKISLCSIGSFVPKKGQELLIKTIKELKSLTNKNIELNLLGDGPLRKDLETLVHQLNLEQEVFIQGKVDFPEKFLNNSNLYVHSASYEPFGLVLIEAMSTGLPVISTDGRGNRDFMDGSNGVLLNHRDPELFAKEILSLIEDKERYLKLQKGALETASKYDIKPYVDRLIKLYQKAIDEQ